MNSKKIMVAGHICLDITPIFKPNRVANLSEVLSPGKLVQVGRADIHTGGAVANTGLAMHFFGADVTLVAKIGTDYFGQVVKEVITRHGANAQLVEDSTVGTSYSVVLAILGVDRVFLHDTGANDTFCASDITDDMLEGISHFHFGYPPLMRRMYEQSGSELLALFQKVKAKGITTSLDMAAIDPNAPVGKADWRGLLQSVLPLVDFFVPSVEEVCYMLDHDRCADWERRADGGDVTDILTVDRDIKPLADELFKMGASTVLIKCGAQGMYYRDSVTEGFEKSFKQENIVSATGAGDTSIAAFLTSIIQGHTLERSVRLAAATGACCITTHDALSGLKPLDALWDMIEQGWEKNI